MSRSPRFQTTQPRAKKVRAHARNAERIQKLRENYTPGKDRALPRLTIPYVAYLRSEHWLELRKRILKERGRQCESCGTKRGPIDLHHLTYARIGREKHWDLLVLCRACHEQRHAGIPAEVENENRQCPAESLVMAGTTVRQGGASPSYGERGSVENASITQFLRENKTVNNVERAVQDESGN